MPPFMPFSSTELLYCKSTVVMKKALIWIERERKREAMSNPLPLPSPPNPRKEGGCGLSGTRSDGVKSKPHATVTPFSPSSILLPLHQSITSPLQRTPYGSFKSFIHLMRGKPYESHKNHYSKTIFSVRLDLVWIYEHYVRVLLLIFFGDTDDFQG